MKKRIFVFLTSLCMLCCMMLMPVQVSAYTADTSLTGYPFVLDDMRFQIYYNSTNFVEFNPVLTEQNSYTVNNSQNYTLNSIYIGNNSGTFIFPYNSDLYDYYFVGTIAGDSNTSFNLEQIICLIPDSPNATKDYFDDLNIYNYSSLNQKGISFSSKLPVNIKNTNLSWLVLDFADDSIISGNIGFSFSFIPIAKDSDETVVLNSVLQKLTEINNNLISTNEILTQHDANVKSWFQQLIQSMGIGFSTLYEQMTKEQDEQLHGYEDTTVSEANEAFTSESDKLTGVENELSGASNQYVTEYTAEGFDLGLFTTLANTFAYIATWFTNFWNMGGIFTKALNLCLALSIGFTILRLH